jgi:hypothetical protein
VDHLLIVVCNIVHAQSFYHFRVEIWTHSLIYLLASSRVCKHLYIHLCVVCNGVLLCTQYSLFSENHLPPLCQRCLFIMSSPPPANFKALLNSVKRGPVNTEADRDAVVATLDALQAIAVGVLCVSLFQVRVLTT